MSAAPPTLAELLAAEAAYIPPPTFYDRLAADTRAVLLEFGPHSPAELRELLRTLRWAEERRAPPNH